jgi:hypothetical protein
MSIYELHYVVVREYASAHTLDFVDVENNCSFPIANCLIPMQRFTDGQPVRCSSPISPPNDFRFMISFESEEVGIWMLPVTIVDNDFQLGRATYDPTPGRNRK